MRKKSISRHRCIFGAMYSIYYIYCYIVIIIIIFLYSNILHFRCISCPKNMLIHIVTNFM